MVCWAPIDGVLSAVTLADLLRVYAKWVHGQDEVAKQRIVAASPLTASAEDPDVVSEPDLAETSGRIPGEQR